uniref:Uncharacterized protein n=1 Tax=Opuntia streptacantha TaxID=393608 RepID=A0A7C9DSA8_OPUST
MNQPLGLTVPLLSLWFRLSGVLLVTEELSFLLFTSQAVKFLPCLMTSACCLLVSSSILEKPKRLLSFSQKLDSHVQADEIPLIIFCGVSTPISTRSQLP